MLTRTETIAEFKPVVEMLQSSIGDEYRASDDPEDDKPGMQVTIGLTITNEDEEGRKLREPKIESWGFQSGDNSYTGGAYGHEHWGVGSLYRDTDVAEFAKDLVYEAYELYFQ